MKIRLFKDDSVTIRLEEIAANLNRLAPSSSFAIGTSLFAVPGSYVASPQTYKKLSPQINEESAADDLVLLFTNKPYDNNFFWDELGKLVIISLYGWEHLTKLSRNNGSVYCVCAAIIEDQGIGISHTLKTTGCINDFWQDKTAVDNGMRAAFICDACLDHMKRTASKEQNQLVRDFQLVLDDLSRASRYGMDVCDYWSQQRQDDTFDVFLCHNTEDKDAIRQMNGALQKDGIFTWFDEEQLPPGRPFQDLLEAQIESIRTAAVFVGKSGFGPWQEVEFRGFLQEFVRRNSPVIPVILSDCLVVPRLPLFLTQFTWVDFRKKVPDPMKQLLWGITGRRNAGN
jgi:TIR domain